MHGFPSAIVERAMCYVPVIQNTPYTCGFVETVIWDPSPRGSSGRSPVVPEGFYRYDSDVAIHSRTRVGVHSPAKFQRPSPPKTPRAPHPPHIVALTLSPTHSRGRAAFAPWPAKRRQHHDDLPSSTPGAWCLARLNGAPLLQTHRPFSTTAPR